MINTTQQIKPALINAREAAAILNIGKSLFYRLHSEAKLPEPTRLGARVLWSRHELEEWIKAGCPNRQKWKSLKDAI